ncbi:hypothetical protein pEaSNUABM6_00087 [Erwinia phage pEa_SNUABM_6]|nr:hypothetical protein pEaSNUABM6_00087 [Erwinia phage pEa_SNUABM_6]
MRKSRLLLALKFLFKGNIFKCRHRMGRVKDFLYGPKKYHLTEPRCLWDETLDHKFRVVRYRRVYCWYGRLYSPFRRTHHKGLELENGVIVPHETIAEYLAALKKADEVFPQLVANLRKATDELCDSRMEA